MSARSFTVFIDSPRATQSTASSQHSPSRPPSLTPATSLPSLAPTAEKENFDPVTGELSGASSSQAAGKKRKTGVLATKVHCPVGGKVKESKPEPKKRKASAFAPKDKAVAGKKKVVKAQGSTRKGGKSSRSSRKGSPLPKVDESEEVENGAASRQEGERLLQTDIDSRCYDLTVSPLADVTAAYENSSPDVKLKFHSIKEKSAEPEFRDYFSPSLSSSMSLPIIPNSSGTPPPETKAFSTPERKEIYAAFTFTSPSPTSERFIKTRTTSEPLDIINFKST